jgi:hypothetical protein
MSAASTINDSNASNSMSEVDDVNMFQAVRRNGRRNALADLGEQIVQGKFIFFFFSSSLFIK